MEREARRRAAAAEANFIVVGVVKPGIVRVRDTNSSENRRIKGTKSRQLQFYRGTTAANRDRKQGKVVEMA